MNRNPLVSLHHLPWEEGLKDFGDHSFDLAIVDPPYGIGEDGRKSRPGLVRQKSGGVLRVKKQQSEEIWDDGAPGQDYFDELFRVARYCIIWGENHFDFSQKASSSGRIFWDKVNGGNDFSDGEIAWTNLFDSVRQVEYMWNGMNQGKSLSEGRVSQGNKSLNEKRIQHCQKPVLLYKWLLSLKHVEKGWRILDTHLGSGSSAIACYDMGFDMVGFEKNANHFNAAKKRFENHCSQFKLRL